MLLEPFYSSRYEEITFSAPSSEVPTFADHDRTILFSKEEIQRSREVIGKRLREINHFYINQNNEIKKQETSPKDETEENSDLKKLREFLLLVDDYSKLMVNNIPIDLLYLYNRKNLIKEVKRLTGRDFSEFEENELKNCNVTSEIYQKYQLTNDVLGYAYVKLFNKTQTGNEEIDKHINRMTKKI